MKAIKALLVFSLTLMMLVFINPSLAVVWGEPDGDDHPYVGLLVFFFGDSNQFSFRCSGTLIAPTIVLTAGHCTFLTNEARVWFGSELPDENGDERPDLLDGSVKGIPYTHPNFTFNVQFPPSRNDSPNLYDIGVVVLEEPIYEVGLAALPTENMLDDLATQRGKKRVSLSVVGYGLQNLIPNPHTVQADLTRHQGKTSLINLNSALNGGFNVQTTNNPGQGNGSGGSCFGDSGGPLIYGENIIVALDSFGLNSNCVGVDFSYRVDIEDARDFLQDFLSLP